MLCENSNRCSCDKQTKQDAHPGSPQGGPRGWGASTGPVWDGRAHMAPEVAIADTQVIDSIRVFPLKTPILGVVQVIDFPRVFILAFFVCLGDNSLMGWEIGPPEVRKE